jgi:hypothetical protein
MCPSCSEARADRAYASVESERTTRTGAGGSVNNRLTVAEEKGSDESSAGMSAVGAKSKSKFKNKLQAARDELHFISDDYLR